MRRKMKVVYWSLLAGGVILGLYPSMYLNVRPHWLHGDTGTAAFLLAVTLFAAVIPLVMPLLRWFEIPLAIVLFGVIIRVSMGNAIESITFARTELTSTHDDKVTSKIEWTARIEEWSSQKEGLKERYIKIGEEKGYTPTSDDVVVTARQGRDKANQERDEGCKASSASLTCKSLTKDARDAQTKLEQVAQNSELTKRVDLLEADIRDAHRKIADFGSNLDPFARAKAAVEGLWFDPLKDREAWTAFAAEGGAALMPRFNVLLIAFLFVGIFGKDWQQESPVRESPPRSLNVQEFAAKEPFTPAPTILPPIQKPRKSTPSRYTKRLLYAQGVKAWVDSIKPGSGQKGQRWSPGTAYPHYVHFCEERGFAHCHLNVLGGILKRECALVPVATVGGTSFYEFNISRPTLALVKASEA